MSGTLYIVATPIGNLEDLSPRARQTLAAVDLIAAEDTRHTGRLLSHIGVKTPLTSLHDHNESAAAETLIKALLGGESIALVSDAGTPLISDPGYRLVKRAHDCGVTVSPIPGPSAVTAALAAAGLPTDRFAFDGFLPAKQRARRAMLDSLKSEPRTIVLFESVHRMADSIDDIAAAFGGDREAFIGRELTKQFEQCAAGRLADLQAGVHDGTITAKGEFVIVIRGSDAPPRPAMDVEGLIAELGPVLPKNTAAAIIARLSGAKRNDIYRRLLRDQ